MDSEDGLQLVQSVPGFKTRGMLICVSGPSGVGKGTVIAQLKEIMPGLTHSVSLTTRSPRPGEVDGKDYYFCTKERFEELLEEDAILEHDIYVGNYYGTPSQAIEDKVSEGQDVIMDVTVPGSLAILYKYEQACSIFLLPPSLSVLRERLEKRGTETSDIINSRLLKAVDEVEMASKFDYIVINQDQRKAAEEIRHIIYAEKLRQARRSGIEQMILKR